MEIKTEKLKAGLYIVATPIGNLRDITIRALSALASADVIVCEDTRITNRLLAHYNIKKPMLVYNDHSGEKMRERIMEKIASGNSVALVSDAGTPLISDPGYKLVRELSAAGFYITSIPGASSVITALTISGMPTDNFYFAGFPPPKEQGRKQFLKGISKIESVIILFIRNSALTDILNNINEVLGEREVAVVREITKAFEEVRRGAASDLAEHYGKNGDPKGEIVLLIAPPDKKEMGAEEMDAEIKKLLKDFSVKEVATKISDEFGVPRKIVYSRALELKNGK